MAVKALIFGVDDLFYELMPLYAMAVQRGDIDVVGQAVIKEDGSVKLHAARVGVDPHKIEVAIISSGQNFYDRMKMLEKSNIPRSRIIDGRVFKIPNLNFSRLLSEGIAYGVFEDKDTLSDTSNTIYPRSYRIKNSAVTLKLGTKTRLNRNISVESNGINSVSFGNFSRMSWNGVLELGLNYTHNHRSVAMAAITDLDWKMPREIYPPDGQCEIKIGSDV